MNTAQKILILMAVALLTLALPGSALAADKTFDHFVFGDNYTLKNGETLDEGLFVMGGNAELEKGSTVAGDVIVMGGNLTADGAIDGNILIMGGRVALGASAVVQGDISTLGGSLDKDPEATVKGDINSQTAGGLSIRIPDIRIPGQVFVPNTTVVYPPLWDALWWLWLPIATLIMAALAIVVVMFWPKPVERAAKAVAAQPFVAGGMGLLTMAVSPFVLVALAITILLIPVVPLAAIVLVAMGVFGWIILGTELGHRLAVMLKQDWHPALAAGLGTATLTFMAVGVDKILFCVGWIVPFLVTALGLGAIILTRFGTQEYPGAVLAPASIHPATESLPPAAPPVA